MVLANFIILDKKCSEHNMFIGIKLFVYIFVAHTPHYRYFENIFIELKL